MQIWTNALQKALHHVRTFHPEITTVVINNKGMWLYFDNDFNSPTFNAAIDVSILEEGADSIKETPFIYQLNL